MIREAFLVGMIFLSISCGNEVAEAPGELREDNVQAEEPTDRTPASNLNERSKQPEELNIERDEPTPSKAKSTHDILERVARGLEAHRERMGEENYDRLRSASIREWEAMDKLLPEDPLPAEVGEYLDLFEEIFRSQFNSHSADELDEYVKQYRASHIKQMKEHRSVPRELDVK